MFKEKRRGHHHLNGNLLDKLTTMFGSGETSEKYSFLSDFTIKAKTGEEIRCFKLILSIQSDFFRGLFETEPQTVLYEDKVYEYHHLKNLFGMPFGMNHKPYAVSDLLRLLEMTDFFGMVDELNSIQDTIGDMITKENVLEIVNSVDMFVTIKASLRNQLVKAIRENVLHLDLRSVPTQFLRNVLKVDLQSIQRCTHIKDGNGCCLDVVRSQLKTCLSLLKLLPVPITIQDVPLETKNRLIFAVKRPVRFELSAEDITLLTNFLQENNLQPVPETDADEPTKNVICSYDLAHFLPHDRFQFEEWSVQGMIRKLKAKIHKPDSQLKGLEIQLQDSTIHSICMEEDNETRVVEFLVPDGQHIKNLMVHEKRTNGLHCFGLVISGPHDETTSFYLGCKDKDRQLDPVGHSVHQYLVGLSGKTYKTATNKKKMATLNFTFKTIDTNDICYSEVQNKYCTYSNFERCRDRMFLSFQMSHDGQII